MPPKPDLNNSLKVESKEKSPVIPPVKAKLLEGKRGLIVGIANENSIAWGCAKAFRAFGAELAVTYLNDKARKYVEPLAQVLEAQIVMPLDVRAAGQVEAVFERIAKQWGSLDFVVHSIAFSPKDALQGRVADVSRDGFLTTMEVSCWTFIRMAHLAEPLMRNGGTLFTMTYYGSQMVVKNYNIMGVAKAALESAVRYLAAELGPKESACMRSHQVHWLHAPHPAFRNSMPCWRRQKRKRQRGASSASTTWAWLPRSSLTMLPD
jgi:enoyl-[acyl-carrier protein] reductase I